MIMQGREHNFCTTSAMRFICQRSLVTDHEQSFRHATCRFLVTIWKTWESGRVVQFSKLHGVFLHINGLPFVISFFFTRSDLDETSCSIRVQMHGVTLSRHQPICAMADCFPDFALSLFFFLFSIHPQILHDLEREYENELLASIDTKQPVTVQITWKLISEPRY